MKKITTICLLLSVLIGMSCSTIKTTSSEGAATSNETKEVGKFLADFEKAVIRHDSKGLLKFIDQNYLQEQYYGFMEGNTEQFLNELFCGNLTNEDRYECLTFKEINRLKLVKLEREDDFYRVAYTVVANGVKINTDWRIIIRIVGGKVVCGLEGSYG